MLPDLFTVITDHLKDVLHGCQYANNADIVDKRQTRFCAQPKASFADGSSKIMNQNNRYVEKKGDCFEKLWCICCCVMFEQQTKK
jgi:hypothetical protein